ncbi:hypothetical protein E4416_09030 [Stenotrophomonas maltophilia]|uniref:hypothetical protein n=1 Tax=Stenotrophomonas maltophilia TaxID=40324 RepID=UPI001110A5B6|nr:hypothetical protein [Stenotrophomonas maltophilia]TIK70871.1 hypothetical protein E4418_03130 [Stenotrophomonas maltophilia]TIK71932.1 hypothetical protein E4416_09030 [Stenotrophomonas maltophilia]
MIVVAETTGFGDYAAFMDGKGLKMTRVDEETAVMPGASKGVEVATIAAERQAQVASPGSTEHADSAQPVEGGAAPAIDQRHESIGQVISDYLSSIRDIADATSVVMPHLAHWLTSQNEEAIKKLEAAARLGTPEEDRIRFETTRDLVAYSAARRNARKTRDIRSFEIMTRALFVQVFCEYDAFIGRLLTSIYSSKPDLMNGISRQISLADLLQFDDIKSACRGLLEKEIETFRRDSYVDQFAALESKFSIRTLKGFPEWKEFVELSQRRNILVHNDGIVSEQYLSVCRKEGVVLPKDAVAGAKIGAGSKELLRLIRVMSKVGYMLGHTLWRKLFPSQLEKMHDSLHMTIYEYLADARWKTAAHLGEFALTDSMTNGMKESVRRMIVINSAIARKFSGDSVGAEAVLDSADWSAAMPEFRLAVAVLKDNFERAGEILRRIGKRGDLLDQWAYHEWPLFTKFRDREDFYAIYEEIYGEPYKEVAEEVGEEVAKEVAAVDGAEDSDSTCVAGDSPSQQVGDAAADETKACE